jgi:hypothetical protein
MLDDDASLGAGCNRLIGLDAAGKRQRAVADETKPSHNEGNADRGRLGVIEPARLSRQRGLRNGDWDRIRDTASLSIVNQ